MPIFAAVDIGANSVRLKIAQLTRRKLKVIHEDREVTRMGESVFRYNTLAPAAMAQTVKVLTRFYRAAQKFRVEQVRVVGTSALRDAKNSRAFTEWVKSAVGWKIDIISGLEEGRLIHLGVLSNLRIENKDVLMFDLGGGSCEITISEHGHIREMFTLPLGAVRLTQEFLLHDPAKSKEIVRMREYIAEQVNRIAPAIRRHRVDLAIATSGTAAALAGAARALQGRSKYSHTVSRKITAKLAQELSARSASERSQFPGIGPKRSEIIVEAEREDALMLLGKRFGVDARHAAHVRSLSQQLFKALKDIHRLPGEYSEWISAAAMLHELGSYVNRNGRHRHTYYLIANSELFGFSPEQRHLVAAIARYMGKSRPSERDRELRNLRPSIRELLNRAVVLLRIARALNQGRRGVVQKLRTRESGAEVTIQLLGKPDMDLEVWAAEKERTYFRDVFGRDLVVKSA
jgi:exopolyphosphatase/guanosine-5'-triphosphate,3'-diphosphate pyrophosphatase